MKLMNTAKSEDGIDIFAAFLSLKYAGRSNPNVIYRAIENNVYDKFIDKFTDIKFGLQYSVMISFLLDDWVFLIEESARKLNGINAYDILLNYSKEYSHKAVLLHVLNPLLKKLAGMRDQKISELRLEEIITNCENFLNTIKNGQNVDRAKFLNTIRELNSMLILPETLSYLKLRNGSKTLMEIINFELKNTQEDLLEKGQIVDFVELNKTLTEMAQSVCEKFTTEVDVATIKYGLSAGQTEMGEMLQQKLAVDMLRSALTNWKGDEKLLENTLSLCTEMLGPMEDGTLLYDKVSQSEVVYLLRIAKNAMGDDGEEDRLQMGMGAFSAEGMTLIKEFCKRNIKKLKCGSVKDILGLRQKMVIGEPLSVMPVEAEGLKGETPAEEPTPLEESYEIMEAERTLTKETSTGPDSGILKLHPDDHINKSLFKS
jgi:hypothetical protein